MHIITYTLLFRIVRWRAASISGSDFTYSSKLSITQIHLAFLAAYRLSHLSCTDVLEKSMTLDPDDPFIIPPGLSGRPTIPPHLLPDFPAKKRCARRLALLLDSDNPDIREWAQAEYLKLGRMGRRLVRKGVFEVKVMLDGTD
ncbi:hypothetical protein F5148DRAFT_1214619 [Russula earlei]|uniref:Uncharacterized protein n=2 Tax=Russula earlei TaxID=71964 RepID=A0ACC0U5F8_9AGAM|nr:hypothetical protein F5148DRAFT_1214619 [Russula earlei]